MRHVYLYFLRFFTFVASRSVAGLYDMSICEMTEESDVEEGGLERFPTTGSKALASALDSRRLDGGPLMLNGRMCATPFRWGACLAAYLHTRLCLPL